MTTTIAQVISDRFGGRLYMGQHLPDDSASILEAASVARGIEWTDSPEELRCWDIRPLNDTHWSTPERRAEQMSRLYERYEGSLDWPSDRQRRVAERIAIHTVNRIIANLPGLPDNVRERCRFARTLEEAQAAAKAAGASARAAARVLAVWAAEAAEAAARASKAAVAVLKVTEAAVNARSAALAAAETEAEVADSDSVLIVAVDLWIEAADLET